MFFVVKLLAFWACSITITVVFCTWLDKTFGLGTVDLVILTIPVALFVYLIVSMVEGKNND